ncbi:MAG: hypothetical protein K0S19_1455, partial [Geminicoccaceae bacterium]|nr:hypothetical protein [Geminicoccaceae bacterium]
GAGPHALLLEAMVTLLALASIITVIQRFAYVHQHAGLVDEALQAEERLHAETVQRSQEIGRVKHAALDPLAKGHSSG